MAGGSNQAARERRRLGAGRVLNECRIIEIDGFIRIGREAFFKQRVDRSFGEFGEGGRLGDLVRKEREELGLVGQVGPRMRQGAISNLVFPPASPVRKAGRLELAWSNSVEAAADPDCAAR